MASKKTAVAAATRELVVNYSQDSLQHCCGVGEVGGFEIVLTAEKPKFPGEDASNAQLRNYYSELERWLSNTDEYEEVDIHEYGTGYFVATFNESEESKFAFARLQEFGHKLVYEADPRRNGPKGNFVSIGIFLHKNAVERDATE